MDCFRTSFTYFLNCCPNWLTKLKQSPANESLLKNKKSTCNSSLEKPLSQFKVSPTSAFNPYQKITEVAVSAIVTDI